MNLHTPTTKPATETETQLLRTLIDSLPDYIFIKDRQSRFLINNLAHLHSLGAVQPEEVIGKTDLDIFPAELANQYYADEQALMASGQELNREETTVHPKTGKRHWLQTTKTPLRDENGEVVGMVGISRDITDRKRAEEALCQARAQLEQQVVDRTVELSQERRLLRTLIDNLPDGIYAKDTAGRKTLSNPADVKVLGFQKEAEVIGKTDFDFFPQDIAAKFAADDQAVIQQRKPVLNREEYYFDAENQKRWLLTSKLPLQDADGKVVGLVGIGRDITGKKQAEEVLRQSRDELEQRVAARTAELTAKNADLAQASEAQAAAQRQLQAMLDNVPDRIYFKDTQSRFLNISQALARRFGLEHSEQAVGKTDFDFNPPEKAGEFYQDEQRIIQSGEPLINKIEKQVLRNGQTAWTSTTKVPMRDKAGKIVGVAGINRDITAMKEAEQKLEKLHRDLLVASRRAGMAEVATGVLHNVGNVLNSVNVSAAMIAERLRDSRVVGVSKLANLLREHSADVGRFLSEDERGRQVPAYLEQLADHLERERAEVRKELESLTMNIEHIKEIVSTQQSYARVSGVTETVALPELVEDALKIHGGAYARHGVVVVREYDPLPTVTVDKHKVLQILVNLFSNAKYACDGGNQDDKRVTVRLKANGEGRVKIEVADTGMGIALENRTRIFSQGFTTRKGGHGFGLHSGALAARELGGSLGVQSDGPGKGATFTLDLPMTPPQVKLEKS